MTEKPASKREIDRTGFLNFLEELNEESDRAAVILGAAKLDLQLCQILQQYLTPVSGGRDELLDDGNSPLGTFSARILLVNRLGLVDDEFTRSLQLVRKIRNLFAHEVSGASLDKTHCDRVRELVSQLRHKIAFIQIREKAFGVNDTPSANFRTALAFLAGRLDTLLSHIEPIDKSQAISIIGEQARAMGETENPRKKKISELKGADKLK